MIGNILEEGTHYTIIPKEGRAYVNVICQGIYWARDRAYSDTPKPGYKKMYIVGNSHGQWDFSEPFLRECMIYP
ncbi:MAG: hypothetical protein LUE14_04575 [Clostridiales bacterium]|nr:hypothetical protein [Clostridiales bacterium]